MQEYVISSDKLRVKLGETKEEILDRLQKANIRYTTPFEGLAGDSTIKETVMNVPDCGIELLFENDIVHYIKSHNSEHNVICETDIGNVMSVDDIQKLLMSVANKFNIDPKAITVRHMNLKRVDAKFIVNNTKNRVEIHLLCDLRGNVFISTLKIISK